MPTEPSIPALPKRKRRRFQFRLRTLLLVFTVVGVILPTLPLLTRPPIYVEGSKSWGKVYSDHDGHIREEDGWVVTMVDPDAKGRLAAIALDATVIGLAIWLTIRGRRTAPPENSATQS
jgi:hypothetical protein